jgi:hypothetical protein
VSALIAQYQVQGLSVAPLTKKPWDI